jgi:acyl-CoA synthetase (AMP-forming)/AMP-acid ligase II
VPKPGVARPPTREALLAFLEGKVAKWWLPDGVAVVDELPHTATGKVDKKALRATFRTAVATGGDEPSAQRQRAAG